MTAASVAAARSPTAGPPVAYRDDGPLARAVGRALGASLTMPPFALLVAAAMPLFATIAVAGDDASLLLTGALVAWVVVAGGASSARPHTDRLRWTVPPLLRLIEYGGLIWIAALAGSSSLPAAFALLCAVAFRHYDLVYRLRYRGVEPPAWVGLVGGGWDGRLAFAYVLLALDALPAGMFVLAGLLAAVFVGESVAGWVRVGRVQAPALYEDEEDEGG